MDSSQSRVPAFKGPPQHTMLVGTRDCDESIAQPDLFPSQISLPPPLPQIPQIYPQIPQIYAHVLQLFFLNPALFFFPTGALRDGAELLIVKRG